MKTPTLQFNGRFTNLKIEHPANSLPLMSTDGRYSRPSSTQTPGNITDADLKKAVYNAFSAHQIDTRLTVEPGNAVISWGHVPGLMGDSSPWGHMVSRAQLETFPCPKEEGEVSDDAGDAAKVVAADEQLRQAFQALGVTFDYSA